MFPVTCSSRRSPTGYRLAVDPLWALYPSIAEVSLTASQTSDSGCSSYSHGSVDQLFAKVLEAAFPTGLHVFVDLEDPDDPYPLEDTLGIWAGWTLTYKECNLGSLCS